MSAWGVVEGFFSREPAEEVLWRSLRRYRLNGPGALSPFWVQFPLPHLGCLSPLDSYPRFLFVARNSGLGEWGVLESPRCNPGSMLWQVSWYAVQDTTMPDLDSSFEIRRLVVLCHVAPPEVPG